jgi:hypothetical protein
MKGVRLVGGPYEGKYIYSERLPQAFPVLGDCGTVIYRVHGTELGPLPDVTLAVPATFSLDEEAEIVRLFMSERIAAD